MNNNIAQELGQRCRKFRNALNISQQALADLIGTTPQNISKLERDGIYNIETIQEISRVLGHDLLSDETDQEGVVGEIGKEILLLLIGGYKEPEEMTFPGCVDIGFCISSDVFWGLSEDRVTKEIFKLEKIGLCVREQFVDLYGFSRDWLFITAKGVMTAKHLCDFFLLGDEKLSKVKTYEMICGSKMCLQEVLDSNEILNLLITVKGNTGFRINFIQYLRNKYEMEVIKFTDREVFSQFFPGHGCFYDMIFSMAIGLNRKEADTILKETFDNQRYQNICEMESQLHIDDVLLKNFEVNFKEEVASIDDHGDNPTFDNEMEVTEELGKLYDDEVAAWFRFSVSPKERYEMEMKKHDSNNPLDWYSREDIIAFVDENILPPNTEEEKETDNILKKVIAMDPSALNFFRFPYAWEENGLAEMIRKKYGYWAE